MQQIGRYQIIGELGRGAMGIVYRAQDPAIGRTIAIKSIRLNELTEEAERERLRERLFREAQSAGMLSPSRASSPFTTSPKKTAWPTSSWNS